MPDITFVAPPFLGHLTQMLALAESLASRGHLVNVVTAPSRAQQVREARATLVAWTIEDDEQALTALWRYATCAKRASAGERAMLDYLVERYDNLYASLREPLLSRPNDIFVIDRALIPAMDLAFSKGLKFLILSRGLGSVHKASWRYPLPYSSRPYPMTPAQTVVNLALRAWRNVVFLAPLVRLAAKRRAKSSALCTYNPFKSAPVVVGNAPLLELYQPVPANVRLVGPILSQEHKTNDAGLTRWLDRRAHVVYAAFGTLATFMQWQLQTLISGLLSTNLPVLLALSDHNFDLFKEAVLPKLAHQDRSRLRVQRFVPQQQVLQHSSVCIFVTHASPNGVLDALTAGKPMVAIPLFGDQLYFAARIEELGVGLRIDKTHMTPQVIQSSVETVVGDPSYLEAARVAQTELCRFDGLVEATGLIEAAVLAN